MDAYGIKIAKLAKGAKGARISRCQLIFHVQTSCRPSALEFVLVIHFNNSAHKERGVLFIEFRDLSREEQEPTLTTILYFAFTRNLDSMNHDLESKEKKRKASQKHFNF